MRIFGLGRITPAVFLVPAVVSIATGVAMQWSQTQTYVGELATPWMFAGWAMGLMGTTHLILRRRARKNLRGKGEPDSVTYALPRDQGKTPVAEWQKRLAEKTRTGMTGYNAPLPGAADQVTPEELMAALRPRGPRRQKQRKVSSGMGLRVGMAAACVGAVIGVSYILTGAPWPTPELLSRIDPAAIGAVVDLQPG